MSTLFVWSIGVAAATLLAARGPAESSPNKREAGPFDDSVLAAAFAYPSFAIVNNNPHWAPLLCSTPRPAPLMSASTDDSTHGKKLYFLFAKDVWAYSRNDVVDQPVGQVLVKESWTPVPVEFGEKPTPDPFAKEDGRSRQQRTWTTDGAVVHRVGVRKELFMMMKLDPSTPGTDKGWVYAVTSPDGKEVRASGMIESCIGCHEVAARDRMLGTPAPKFEKDPREVPATEPRP